MLEVLRMSRKVVGLKQCLKVIDSNSASCVYLAEDADDRLQNSIKEACNSKQIEVIPVESMKLLGKACGIEVGSAVACILK